MSSAIIDEDDDPTESSSGKDFSASDSDEWLPEKKKNTKKSRFQSSSSDSDSDEELVVERTQKPNVPKVIKKRHSDKGADDESDSSGSSGDDYLVDPNQLDIGSTFFEPSTSAQHHKREAVPVFDCNTGLGHLSDSDDGSEDAQDPYADTGLIVGRHTNLNTNVRFMLDLERAKEHFGNMKSEVGGNSSNCDVGQLLAMGETKPLESTSSTKPKMKRHATKSKQHPKNGLADSESDWEEVAEKKAKTEDVIITVKPTTIKQKKDRAQLDMEAQLKRALNRRRKEVQLLMHKSHILCWIGHGNHLNSILNHPKLMQLCLSFMPSKYTYPKDRVDLAYIEQISKWYATQMKLKSKRMHPDPSWTLPPLPTSLALQIRSKEAICKKTFVLMFVILLRAIGVQCRLVMNLVLLPIRPPSADLLPITATQAKKESGEVKGKTSKSSNTSKSSSKDKDKLVDKVVASGSGHKKPVRTQKLDPKVSDKLKSPSGGSSQTSKPTTSSKKSSSKKKLLPSHDEKSLKSSKSRNIPSSAEKPEKLDSASKKPTQSKSKMSSQSNKDGKSTTQHCSPHFPSKSQSSSSFSSNKNPPKTISATTTTSGRRVPSPLISPHFPSKSKPSSSLSSNNGLDPKHEQVSPHFPSKSKPSSSLSSNKEPAPKHEKEPNPINRHPVPVPSLASPVAGRTRTRLARRPAMPHLPQLDGNDDRVLPSSHKKKPKRTAPAARADADSDDSDYISPAPRKKPTINATEKSKQPNNKKPENKVLAKMQSLEKRDRRLLSTDVDEENDLTTQKQQDKQIDVWVEVYAESEEQWMAVDLFKQKVHCIDSIRQGLTKPISYIFAWNNDNSIKDVSSRYCLNWNTVTRLQRVERVWLDQALMPFRETPTFRTRAEDLELNKIHTKEPLPKVIGEFKNHPLYALERHLLKFEGIYPADAPTLGFIRGEPVYARECVHTMHSREIWLKSARVVRPGQTAYKVVKARPKWDRRTNTCLEAQPLEIFGLWQTMPYDPPTAENGIVPRNAYGNVELFKPEMLPKKTVHLQLPALNRTCKKLNIDCASAVVGFDYHSGGCHPTYDGFVVCEEFAEQAVAQYWIDQEEAHRREEEKVKERVYGNWKKLIRGLLIRQRLQRKYNFNESGDGATASSQQTAPPTVNKKSASSAKRTRK